MMMINIFRYIRHQSIKTAIPYQISKRYQSSKLTSSYIHHSSTSPLIYKTVGQCLDEITDQHPNNPCYVFKSTMKRSK